MKVVGNASLEKIEEALAAAYIVSTDSVRQPNRVPTPAFMALSASFATISSELGIDLIDAVKRMRRAAE